MGLNDFSAKDVINNLDQKELQQIFKYFGEEKNSKLISKKIIFERQKKFRYSGLSKYSQKSKKSIILKLIQQQKFSKL